MPSDLTYTSLLTKVKDLADRVSRSAEWHQKLASQLDDEAQDVGRIAEQIGVMDVDAATIAETQELAKIMAGISQAAIAYAGAADNAARAARAAEQQTLTDHAGIHEAARCAPIPDMAARGWYTQE
jgi:hypothetical protein